MRTQTAYFNRFVLEIPVKAIGDCSHQGACDEDVKHWSRKIERPDSLTAELLASELKEYGAWNSDELADDSANWERIIWSACCNLKDENRQQEADLP